MTENQDLRLWVQSPALSMKHRMNVIIVLLWVFFKNKVSLAMKILKMLIIPRLEKKAGVHTCELTT